MTGQDEALKMALDVGGEIDSLRAALTAAAEREQGLREELRQAVQDRRVDFGRATRAEAEVERLKGELEAYETIVGQFGMIAVGVTVKEPATPIVAQMQDGVRAAESALAAERQKVTALREWLDAQLADAMDKRGYLYSPIRGAYRNCLDQLDALGLPSPDAPQPPQEKERTNDWRDNLEPQPPGTTREKCPRCEGAGEDPQWTGSNRCVPCCGTGWVSVPARLSK